MDSGSSSNTPLIVGIAIVTILTVFILAVIAGWYLSARDVNINPAIVTTSGTFLSFCTNVTCADNLVCDQATFTCKLPAGEPCTDFADCATGLICSGLCATGTTGFQDDLCPCTIEYTCVPQPNGLTLCKGIGGTPCDVGADCASGLCLQNGTCATGAPNSFPCSSNQACASDNCSNGFCQASGVVTGVRGAACAAPCVTFAGAGCSGTIEEPLACVCSNGVGNPGVCTSANQGLLSVCAQDLLCANQLVCLNDEAAPCSGTGCLCTFPYTDPNDIDPELQCIEGMSLLPQTSTCFNNAGLGCDSGGLCATRSCGGPSVLAVYQFSRETQENLGADFIGATTTAIVPAAAGPAGLIRPHKMFATSNDDIDIIYLVDDLQGLLVLQYNPITMMIISPWQQLIPHTITTEMSTRTLIDVGYNGTTFIVAFNEMLTSGVTNDTVYSGMTATSLTPFNVQPGSGITGTQYTIDGTPLSIDYIDISPANSISPGGDVLISVNGTIYIKQSTETNYSVGIIQGGPMNGRMMTGLTGPARFYLDNIQNAGGTGPPTCPQSGNNPVQCPSYNNVSFVGPFTGFGGGMYDQVLQFSGNVAGYADPIDRFEETAPHVQYHVFEYSIYSPPPTGMTEANMIMLTQAFQGGTFIDNIVNIGNGGNTTPVPYRISTTSRSVATANAFYVLSLGSCV